MDEKCETLSIYNWIINLYRNFDRRRRIFSDSSLHVVTVVGTPFDVLLGRVGTISVVPEETDKILKPKIILYMLSLESQCILVMFVSQELSLSGK